MRRLLLSLIHCLSLVSLDRRANLAIFRRPQAIQPPLIPQGMHIATNVLSLPTEPCITYLTVFSMADFSAPVLVVC